MDLKTMKQHKEEIERFIYNWQPHQNFDYAQDYFKNDLLDLLDRVDREAFERGLKYNQ